MREMQVNLILSLLTKIFYAFRQLDQGLTSVDASLLKPIKASKKLQKKLQVPLRDQLTPWNFLLKAFLLDTWLTHA